MEMIKETAKVVRQQQIDEGIFDMELSFPKGAALAKPGQFIAMYCNDKSKLLPRPIRGNFKSSLPCCRRGNKRIFRDERGRYLRSYGTSR